MLRADLVEELKAKAIAAGLYAANMPADVGGAGLDTPTWLLYEKELGRANYALHWTCVGRPSNILLAGTPEQRERYLLPCIRGEKSDCLAMTEPGAGSDLRGMKASAVQDGGDWVLNGTKHFISHADVADFAIVFMASGEEDSARGKRKKITAFFVDKGTKGFSVRDGYRNVSHRGYRNSILEFDDCRLPASQVLGEVHKGFDVANSWLGATRLQVAATCLGRAERALGHAVEYAAQRQQFGQQIGKFQGVSFKLADMATELKAAELMVMEAGWKYDQGTVTDQDMAMAKLKATEMLAFVADEAIQIHGGMGLMDDLPLERIWRDARVERIWEGTRKSSATSSRGRCCGRWGDDGDGCDYRVCRRCPSSALSDTFSPSNGAKEMSAGVGATSPFSPFAGRRRRRRPMRASANVSRPRGVAMHRLERLLRPRSIAVFGGVQAAAVVKQCLKMDFAGDIWPVHPTKDEVAGVRAYRSVAELPGAPDAAFVGVNRFLTLDIIRELSARGAGGAICFAAGFLETGDYDADGERLQRELIDAAGDMPIIGPNCYGLINYADGALLWPDQHGGVRLAAGTRGVGIITQSSNIACNLTMQKRGLPVAFLMTAGNQAQTGLSEMALGLIEDDRVSALGLHIEGFDSVGGFERLASRARELRKPIVAMKVGRSEQARAATISHTASLAGSDAASDAFLKRLGIARVDSIPSFLESLMLLHAVGPLSGRRLSSMSCSGGEASVMADSARRPPGPVPGTHRCSPGKRQGDARAAGRRRQSARLPHLHLEQPAGDDGGLHGDGVGRLRPQHAGARFPARRPLLGRRLVADGQCLRGCPEHQQGQGRGRRLDAGEPAGAAGGGIVAARHRAAARHRRSDGCRRGGGRHRRGVGAARFPPLVGRGRRRRGVETTARGSPTAELPHASTRPRPRHCSRRPGCRSLRGAAPAMRPKRPLRRRRSAFPSR